MFKRGRKVFIGGFGVQNDADDLRKLLADVGGVTYATVWKDAETGRAKGAGKIEFESMELAQKAVEFLREAVAGSMSFATIFSDADTGQVDVRYDQVINWLKSRGKLAEDWPKVLRRIESQASSAMAAATSEAADLDYFKVEEAYGLLERSENEARDTFKAVLDAYRQSNSHVAEAAKRLVELARIDLPAAKAEALSFQKQVPDVERRQRDVAQEDIDAQRKLRELCSSHGITGNDFVTELRSALARKVPEILETAARSIETACPELLKFYSAFSKSLHAAGPGDNAMPLLRYVMANGNASLKGAADLSDELKSEWKELSNGDESMKLLENTFARSLVLTELLELQTFLSERMRELEQQGTEEIPMSAEISLEETKTFYDGIGEAVASLSGKHTAPLLLMNGSETTFNKTVSELNTQKSLSQRLASKSAMLEKCKAELAAEADLHVAATGRLQAQCRHLKSWLEEELSRIMKYKVCLVGEVANF